MTKFKVNETVCVKGSYETGVIKSIEKILMSNGETHVEYIVKCGEGFSNWKKYSRKQLEHFKDLNNKNKATDYLVVETKDKLFKIILVAIVQKEDVDFYDFEIEKGYTRKGRKLSIGYSICNPSDEYNFEQGFKIAKHRAKKKPFCELTSGFGGEFNHETVMALLNVKGEYIANNIQNFVNKQ